MTTTISNLAGPMVQAYASIRDELADARRIFDNELLSDVACVEELCTRLGTYRGKMLRPALLLLSGRAAGALSPNHSTVAAVIEMVHVATLVHDDVLDESDERRRRPTIRAAEGNVAAVLLGDYLISHAFHLCSSLDSCFASRRIGATTNTVCEGELLQTAHVGDEGLSESDYLEIVRRKTAALTATSCELGAHLSGAERKVIDALREYGMACGIAFQIVDDVLDIVGDQTTVGKTLGVDLACGKLTLPTIHCLAHSDEATRAIMVAVLRGEARCDQAEVRKWHELTGSIEYAEAIARTHVTRAVECLTILAPSDARSSLSSMAEFIVERQS